MLYNFLALHNPYWRLTESSDVLRFSPPKPQNLIDFELSAEQAARIRK